MGVAGAGALPPAAGWGGFGPPSPVLAAQGPHTALSSSAALLLWPCRVVAQARDNGAVAAVPEPKVRIDNESDPFATVVTIEYGDMLGELLDTVRCKLQAAQQAGIEESGGVRPPSGSAGEQVAGGAT